MKLLIHDNHKLHGLCDPLTPKDTKQRYYTRSLSYMTKVNDCRLLFSMFHNNTINSDWLTHSEVYKLVEL